MKKLFYLGFVILFLSGCATTTTIKFDPMANQNIRTISLAKVPNPPGYTVVQSMTAEKTERAFATVGGLLGLLLAKAGSATASSEREEAGSILTKEMSDSGFNFGRQMTEELARALRNANYEVVDYSSSSNEEARLEMVQIPFVGYRYSSASGTEVSPLVAVNIRLISSKGAVLYFSSIAYGEVCSSCFYAIKPSERYNFDLTKPGNKALIVEGLQAGIAAIAEQVAADLRK